MSLLSPSASLSRPKQFLSLSSAFEIYGVLGVARDVTLLAHAPMPFIAYFSTRLML